MLREAGLGQHHVPAKCYTHILLSVVYYYSWIVREHASAHPIGGTPFPPVV